MISEREGKVITSLFLTLRQVDHRLSSQLKLQVLPTINLSLVFGHSKDGPNFFEFYSAQNKERWVL